jgi:predicted dehydrogenase
VHNVEPGETVMDKVRIGILGIGKMGRTHIEALRDVERGEAVAVTDPAHFPDAGPNLAREYGLDYEEDIDALVARKDIDAVIVTTPHAFHAAHAVQAFQAGKHVLVEKPLELTLEKCNHIIEAAALAKRKLMVAQSHRYWEGGAIAKQLLKEGAIGNLLMCRDVLAGPGYRKFNPEKAWFTDLSLYGPGGLIAWGVHDTDRLRWWFDSEADTVFAHSFSLRTEVPDDRTSDMVMITFQNGGCAHLLYSEALPPPGWKGYSCHAQLIGDEGLMDVDPYNQVRVARKGTGEWETVYDHAEVEDPRQKAFSDEVRDFVRCIVDDTPPPVRGADGRAAVEICLAAYRSSETGEAVKLPLAD